MIDKFFRISEQGSTVRREIIGGITTFITMSYIIFVQPVVLSACGMDKGAVLVATCLSSALAIFVMKSAGVNIKNEQKKVTYKFNGDSIEGRQDVEIDEKIWDIKSASPYSFEKKFGEAGGFTEVVKEDSFGYASQGFLYGESQKKNFGGWIAINKSTGEWTVCETPQQHSEYKKKALDAAKDNIKAIKEGKPFKRCYDDIAETFRSKPTGNRVLGFVCSYCPYKLPCWGSDKLQLLPQQQSKGKNPKWVWYTSVTNPKEETEEFSGG